ncbi:transposase [Ancylobacter novellus]|uniref:transposase n=1 Tax=Ancylobacter novellus TaxID=921 RepID=UPI00031FBC5B
MGKATFTEDFKREAVVQITERGYPVAEVARETDLKAVYARHIGALFMFRICASKVA